MQLYLGEIIMKSFFSNLLAFILILLFTGCSSSVQHVLKPNLNDSLIDTESIIQLERPNNFVGSARKPYVIANNKIVGEIANGDELLWKTKSDSLECIGVAWDIVIDVTDSINMDEMIHSYKCFSTKPKRILKLKFDVFYSKQRIAHSIAFAPIFKYIDKTKISQIRLNSVSSSVKDETNQDLILLLQEAIKKQFKNNLTNESLKSIDLEILDYKRGNAALRWLGESYNGSSIAKVKVTIKENNLPIDTFVTRPVILGDGLFSIGGDDRIFDEVAEDIYLYLFPVDGK